jgi:hypothetical protein
MLFLLIENKGVADYQGFTVFGATSKRNSDNQNIIGTFGSGSKMAIGTLLRSHINPQIFCGLTKLTFYTKPMKIKSANGDSDHKQVCVQFKGQLDGAQINRQEDLSFVLDYGTHDWTDISLAMREFVSNAIDGQIDSTGDFKGVNIQVVDESKVRAKDGYTRVYVPLESSVQKFFDEIGKWFLHFSEPDIVRENTEVLQKRGRNRTDTERAVIYRRGVYVREFMASDEKSLFDYNLDIQLNEARTFDDWAAKHAVAKALRSSGKDVLSQVFAAIVNGKDVWELTLDECSLIPYEWEETEEDIKTRQEAWAGAAELVLGERGAFCESQKLVIDMVSRKGFTPVSVSSSAWLNAAKKNGCRTADSILTSDDKAGRTFLVATEAATKARDLVWEELGKLGFLFGKEKPGVGTFVEPIECESQTCGLYRPENKTVYLNKEYAENLDEKAVYIMVEECVHHLSGASDFSRDFQTLLVQIIGRMFWKNREKI